MTQTQVRTAVVLPMAAALPRQLPRTAEEARRWCGEANAATRGARARRDAEHRARMTELDRQTEAAKAEEGALGRRPASTLNLVEVYARLNRPPAVSTESLIPAWLAAFKPPPARPGRGRIDVGAIYRELNSRRPNTEEPRQERSAR